MTRYTVVWTRSALNELARIWNTAVDRQAVTDAADQIDLMLSFDAALQGIELSEGLRALFSPPLKALFHVKEDDRIVEVLLVRHV